VVVAGKTLSGNPLFPKEVAGPSNQLGKPFSGHSRGLVENGTTISRLEQVLKEIGKLISQPVKPPRKHGKNFSQPAGRIGKRFQAPDESGRQGEKSSRKEFFPAA
jgi:hypothetical protein